MYMKPIIALLMIAAVTAIPVDAQKRKAKPASRSRTTTPQPSGTAANRPRVIGSTVTIVTKNGDRITGELLDLSAYSVRIKANNLESTLTLDSIASLSLSGSPAPTPRNEQASGPVRPDFARDADIALGFFGTLITNLKTGVDYTEYGRQLTEARRSAERLIGKYSSTDNPGETRVISLVAGALTDYTWARTIWTLKFGRTSDGTIAESESPVVVDVLTLYPDLRTSAAAGGRLSAEKLLGGVWRIAADKIERARTLISQR